MRKKWVPEEGGTFFWTMEGANRRRCSCRPTYNKKGVLKEGNRRESINHIAFSFNFLHILIMNDLHNLIEGGVNKQRKGRANSLEINRRGASIRDSRVRSEVVV